MGPQNITTRVMGLGQEEKLSGEVGPTAFDMFTDVGFARCLAQLPNFLGIVVQELGINAIHFPGDTFGRTGNFSVID